MKRGLKKRKEKRQPAPGNPRSCQAIWALGPARGSWRPGSAPPWRPGSAPPGGHCCPIAVPASPACDLMSRGPAMRPACSTPLFKGFPGGSLVKNPPAMLETQGTGSVPGSGRSPGGGHGTPLQCCHLENSMDRGAWWATAHGFPKSWTQFSN